MKVIWLDDLRDPKDYGYPHAIWFKTSQEILNSHYLSSLQKGYRFVDEWHFDNDLGEESYQDGYDVFKVLEELLVFGKPCFGNPKIYVHTSNPSAANKFMLAKDSMERYGVEIKRVNY
ncbi:hypothetical protein [Klebsiella phage 05F01]|nr:hypothetical protein [Klebsiella phage 05F01]